MFFVELTFDANKAIHGLYLYLFQMYQMSLFFSMRSIKICQYQSRSRLLINLFIKMLIIGQKTIEIYCNVLNLRKLWQHSRVQVEGQLPEYMDYAYEDRGVYYFKWYHRLLCFPDWEMLRFESWIVVRESVVVRLWGYAARAAFI